MDCPVEGELEASTVQRTAGLCQQVMAIRGDSNLRYSWRTRHWIVELEFLLQIHLHVLTMAHKRNRPRMFHSYGIRERFHRAGGGD